MNSSDKERVKVGTWIIRREGYLEGTFESGKPYRVTHKRSGSDVSVEGIKGNWSLGYFDLAEEPTASNYLEGQLEKVTEEIDSLSKERNDSEVRLLLLDTMVELKTEYKKAIEKVIDSQ